MTNTLKILAVATCATCSALMASCSPGPALTLSEAGTSQCQLSPDECMEFVWLEDLNLWMGKQEMTSGQMRCLFPSAKDQHQDYYAKDWDKETSPAVNVSWKQAQKACRALNRKCAKQLPHGYVFRLPTEGEWEAAASCGRDRTYPWGDSWPPAPMADSVLPNLQGLETISSGRENPPTSRAIPGYKDGWPSTCPVDQSGMNEWGLFGMAGNVQEWCEGWYNQQQQLRLLKGCSAWEHQAQPCEIAARDCDTGQSETMGFFFWGEVRNDGHNYSGLRLVIGKPVGR